MSDLKYKHYNESTSHFKFEHLFKEILDKEMTFREMRLKGFELAKQKKSGIGVRCYNEYLRKWEFLGTYYPSGIMIDSFGGKNILSEDGNNFITIKDEPTKME